MLAKELAPACSSARVSTSSSVSAKCRVRRSKACKLAHPFYDRTVPVVLGEHVTLDAGTGLVHTAPGHGQEDYAVGMKYKLKIDNPVGSDGRFVAGTPLFEGEHVFEANKHVIAVLKERGALLHEETLKHSYPHCWRHKTPVIFRATAQWFISMEQAGLRKGALREIGKVKWMPAWGESRIGNMIADRPDWCISRQRVWGVPLALFTHRATGEPHPRSAELLDAVAARVEKDGIDAWDELDPVDLLGAEAKNYEKVKDILDVWFDSGVSHQCVSKHWPEVTHARGPVPGRLGSASRLVPQLAADVGRVARPCAVSRRADARVHDRREGPQDVEVARQRHPAAEGHRHAGCGRAAPVDRSDRLRERDESLGRDPEAHRRVVPAHPQYRALPARQSRRASIPRRTRCRPTSWWRSIAGRCGAPSSCRKRSWRPIATTSSTSSIRRCTTSAASISAASISTC